MQSELRCRGHISVATYIDSIQKNEKEKLLLYAAKHMDELQAGSDLLKPHLDTTPQTDYNNDHLQRLEIIISEAIEGIQCEKVEMVEADSSDPTVSAWRFASLQRFTPHHNIHYYHHIIY